MQTINKRLAVVGVAGLLVIIAGLLGQNHAPAAATPQPPAFIVANTTANPVPVVQQGPISVAGGVAISGTPNVNVANTTASPVPVVSVGSAEGPGRRPFEETIRVLIDPGEYQHPEDDQIPVPAGKNFVVENVNVNAQMPVGQKLVGVRYDAFVTSGGGQAASPVFIATPFRGNSPGENADICSGELGPGTVISTPLGSLGNITLTPIRDGTTGTATVFVSLHGYLVSVP